MSNKQLFASIVATTIGHLELLITALDAEYRALTGRDPQELHSAVRHKLEVLADVEPDIAARDRIQTDLGIPPGLEGGQRFVSDHAPELQAGWQQLTELCETVRNKNAANGQLVMQGTRQTRNALAVLTGRQENTPTYGRKGRNKGVIDGLSLGRV